MHLTLVNFSATLFAWAAIAIPTLLAYNVSPSATFLNQATSLVGWGLFMAYWSFKTPSSKASTALRATWPMLAALAICVASGIASAVWKQLPMSLTLSTLGLIAAAALVLFVGGMAGQRPEEAGNVFNAVGLAFLSAGLLSAAVACVQTFAPAYADSELIAAANASGRAGGNLRQPNHLSSLLLWALAALVWLQEAFVERETFAGNRRAWRIAAVVFTAVLAFGLVLTVSRTGSICIALLTLWGVFDRRLSRFTRRLLWLLPVLYVVSWLGMNVWSQAGAHQFAGDAQIHRSDISSSRFGIWSNALWLIAHHPWFGVGWGEFNFAWTLTPFPDRPVAFFDHTHNLPLQFIVEMGLPLGLLALGLIGYALYRVAAGCLHSQESSRPLLRCAFVMVLMMLIHSMLEYPLWYAYFLLPTVFVLGLALGAARPLTTGEPATHSEEAVVAATPSRHLLIAASVLLTLGALWSVMDYWRVVAVFSPDDSAPPLQTRVARGQRSWFFSHHADYAAATTEGLTSEADPFKRASHYLLDTRLMMAWANAYAARGDVERARYLAQRLREFHNEQSNEYFAECDKPVAAGEKLPYQCTPPSKAFTYEDFR